MSFLASIATSVATKLLEKLGSALYKDFKKKQKRGEIDEAEGLKAKLQNNIVSQLNALDDLTFPEGSKKQEAKLKQTELLEGRLREVSAKINSSMLT